MFSKHSKQPLKLSHNTQKHIQKHYHEFGFQTPKQFSREEILRLAEAIIASADRMFTHQSQHENALIFLHNDALLIIDAKKYTIKTMFKISNHDYIGLKLRRKFWIEIPKN